MPSKRMLQRWYRCVDCGVDVDATGQWFMVHNAVWAASGLEPEGPMLCLVDLEPRLGRPLVYDDFAPTDPVNARYWDNRDRMLPEIGAQHALRRAQ